jgi:RNA polymerase sigma-70 factor (ECF subfamily)
MNMQDIIQQVLAGNQEAYRHVVEQYQDMLLAYASFRVPDRDAVDEVVQRTFIRAYEQLDQFRTGRDFGVWLRAICKFMIMEELKRRTRAQVNREKYGEYLKHQLLRMAADAADAPDADMADILRACMEALQENARELIQLRYTAQKSVDDIAAALDRSFTWVTSSLHRVRGALRTCIEKRVQGTTS